MLVAQEGHPEVLGLVAHQDCAVALRSASFDLSDRRLDIPKRSRHHRDQAFGIGARPFKQKVVVDAHAFEHEFTVVQTKKASCAKATDVWIENVRVDLLFVHERKTCFRLHHRIRDFVVLFGEVRNRSGVSCHRIRAGHTDLGVAHHPDIAPIDVSYLGYVVSPLARNA